MTNFTELIKDVLVPLVANVGLLSILAWILFIYGRKIFLRPLIDSTKTPILLGFVFGAVSAVVMFLPIELAPGVITDSRGVPIIFAGIIGGPISAVIASVIGIVVRHLIGGPGWLAGSGLIVAHGVIGLIARYFFRSPQIIPNRWTLVVIAFFATVATLPAILLLPKEFQFGVLTQIMPQLLVANIIGSIILGTLISRVEKRYLLEQSLTETKMDVEQANKRLGNSEARFRTVFEQAAVGVAIIDSNTGKFLQINKRYCEIVGYSCEEMLGFTFKDITHPSDLQADLDNMKKMLGGIIDEFTMEKRYFHKDKSIVWVNLSVSPTWKQGGTPDYHIAIVENITGRKQMEQEKSNLEVRLQQAQKMESIGTLAGGIAHDFNNLLYPIIGFSEMLKEDLPQGSPEQESAQEIFNAGRRGGELVKQILAFSRQTEHKLSPVRFQKILKEVCKLTRSTIPSDIEIHQDIQKNCGLVMAEATQLHQIAMNLITNAYHAVEKASGKISIQLKEIILDNDDLKDSPLQPGKYVMLSVSDNGVGIPKEIMNNIFEPYFTTKEKGKGTGLGLAVVYGILTEHKGDIKVYSEKGKGTTFNVYLPLMKKYDETISTEKELNKLTGTERILLVDDEESVVRLEKLMLERLGYKISARSNSLEALETFNSNPDGYDLVISDMTMPNMTGDQLAREIMSIRPDIPIIICTGFSERINKEQSEAYKVKGFLMKPVVKSEMAQMVRKVLDDAKISLRILVN